MSWQRVPELPMMMLLGRALRLALLGSTLAASACASLPDTDDATSSSAVTTDAERATAARLDAARDDAPKLEAFLHAMPKGADLHNHLSGAVFAESYIRWAREDGLCLSTANMTLVPAAQCGSEGVVALPAGTEDPLYGEILRAWSMEGFTPSPQESGHDHFFATFGKFGRISGARTGDMLAEAATRAAGDGTLYLELMLGISASQASRVADSVWGNGPALTADDFATMYDRLLASADWSGVMSTGTRVLDEAEAKKQTVLGCAGATPAPGCGVTVRYLYQAVRTGKPHEVFAQFVAAFEIAMREPRVVGMNLVSPEDNAVSLRDYDLHMAMLDFLHRKYAGRSPLRIALHAGELAASILPPESLHALTFHIRDAVKIGHAERIGHGVDVLSEDDSPALLDELHDENVLVEACLSSNADILSVSGENHPLAKYLERSVPIALATDDPGVARSNLTLEHVRAVNDQHLGYLTLKRLSRDSLEHAFVPGESLWRSLADNQPNDACRDVPLGDASPTDACSAMLARSERARLQWELERRFSVFERSP
jgi:hypothetical protein